MAMRYPLAGAAMLLLASCSIGTDFPAATQRVDIFRRLFEAGKCAEIYRSAARDLTSAITEPGWVSLCQGVHANMGKMKSAKQVGWNDNFNNGDHFVVLDYATEFEKGPAHENFVLRMVDGKASLAGYHMTPDQPAK